MNAQWHDGTMVQCNGTMERWYNGLMVQWLDGDDNTDEDEGKDDNGDLVF